MNNSISQKFTFLSLIKFTIPSIAMILFMSLYSIADGVFVSRFINTDALSSINIVYPYINLVFAVGIMLGCGSSAVIARKLSENKQDEAKQNFTLIIICGIVIGLIISLLGYIFRDTILNILGASPNLYDYCLDYLLGSIAFVPAYILSCLFQYLSITAGKPKIGFFITLIGGISNIILDYLFIVIFNLGIIGAALATGIGVLIPSIIGIVYFTKRRSSLYFVKPKLDVKMLIKSCSNGSSEMVSNLSMGITTMLFNIITMKYLGSDGVAAITIVLYGNTLITSIYRGFSSGVAPVISYKKESTNKTQLQDVIKYSFIFISINSIALFIIARVFTPNIVSIFANKGSVVYRLANKGFLIYSVSFVFAGLNIYTSAMFTAFCNGRVSAIISFIRTFLLPSIFVLVLPKVFDIHGIWLTIVVSETLTLFVSMGYIAKYKNIYKYIKTNKEQLNVS